MDLEKEAFFELLSNNHWEQLDSKKGSLALTFIGIKGAGVYYPIAGLIKIISPERVAELDTLLPKQPENGKRFEQFTANVSEKFHIPLEYNDVAGALSITINTDIAEKLLAERSRQEQKLDKANNNVMTGKAGLSEDEKNTLGVSARLVNRRAQTGEFPSFLPPKELKTLRKLPFKQAVLEYELPILIDKLAFMLEKRKLTKGTKVISGTFQVFDEFGSGDILFDASGQPTFIPASEEQDDRDSDVTYDINKVRFDDQEDKEDKEREAFAKRMRTEGPRKASYYLSPELKLASRRTLGKLIDSLTASPSVSETDINKAIETFVAEMEPAITAEIATKVRATRSGGKS